MENPQCKYINKEQNALSLKAMYDNITNCSTTLGVNCDNSTENLLVMGYDEDIFSNCNDKYFKLKDNIDNCVEKAKGKFHEFVIIKNKLFLSSLKMKMKKIYAYVLMTSKLNWMV